MEKVEGDISSECKKLESVLDARRHAFVIPPEQRPYAWDTCIVDDLFNDIKRAKDRGDAYYLLGSIVVHTSGGTTNEVIDGQQRLTTLLMMYAVLHNRLRNMHKALGSDEDKHDRDVLLARVRSRCVVGWWWWWWGWWWWWWWWWCVVGCLVRSDVPRAPVMTAVCAHSCLAILCSGLPHRLVPSAAQVQAGLRRRRSCWGKTSRDAGSSRMWDHGTLIYRRPCIIKDTGSPHSSSSPVVVDTL